MCTTRECHARRRRRRGARGAKPTTQNGTWEPTCHQRVPLVGNLARDAKGLAIERFDLVLFANEPHLGLLGRPTNQTLNINKQRRSCAQRDTHAVCTDRSERPLLLLLTLPQARVARSAGVVHARVCMATRDKCVVGVNSIDHTDAVAIIREGFHHVRTLRPQQNLPRSTPRAHDCHMCMMQSRRLSGQWCCVYWQLARTRV